MTTTRHFAMTLLAGTLLTTTGTWAQDAANFNRIASFPVVDNKPEGADVNSPSSAEIITATGDGMTLIYSDSPAGGIGFIDITDAAAPVAGGFLAMDGGEPTAVSVSGSKVLVGVNTTEDLTQPSGFLAVVDIESREVEAQCDLGGQPDSTAVSPDGTFATVAIENQRDEELNDGVIPQMPAGDVKIFPLTDGVPDCDAMITVDLTGIAEIAPEDPEPEFVDFNEANELAVTLQENNHIAIINAADGTVTAHFSAGSVDLTGIDTEDDGAFDFSGSATAVKREPDAVQWLDNDRLAIANEGDYEGGSRGFTIMNKAGEVLFESGSAFEHEVALIGHYPDGRSDAKGIEPEGMEVARFGDETLILPLSERGSVVGVYRDNGADAEPELLQIVPSGISPEGIIAIPERNLFAVANEVDLIEDGGVRAHVMIFERSEGPAQYPTIVSTRDENDLPISFGALSGLAADPSEAGRLYAVSDSVFAAQPRMFVIDATAEPAQITNAFTLTRDGVTAENMDLEGIVADGEGGFWLANEGDAEDGIPHALYRVDAEGAIQEEVLFPEALLEGATASGAEGVTMIDGTLWIAIQREWGNDPEGMVKLVSYTPASGEWAAVHYPLEAKGEGWVGLSEITLHGDYVYIIERDNQIGAAAALKKLYRVPVAELEGAELGGELPVVTKEEVRDFIPDLAAYNGYIVDKVEGFAVDANGEAFVVTDNDGVDDSSGETFFWSIGALSDM
ncbi:esterase-like activity of phytase family protein [Rhizobium sp. EC-SD404]|uniref:esterase-like activity of phytase family protein n=1 Tax=Rhizobium sp. EC-SD404 TaxID=2038389 RepID=UPI00125A9232|nr:esterase-like activity of phytase family protein [Rhizobium sp. EC-SD404]VVT19824.1 Esterase-like activity of phytase [Rhizobium sp. EC-SD404]